MKQLLIEVAIFSGIATLIALYALVGMLAWKGRKSIK